MRKITTLLAIVAVLAAQVFADNCHTFTTTCGDDDLCPQGQSTTWHGNCEVHFCNDASQCTCDTTQHGRVKRVRDEYTYVKSGSTYFCITSNYSDTSLGCCNCDGGQTESPSGVAAYL